MRVLFVLMWKEAIHIRRDPRSLVAALLLPLLMLLLFGYAIQFDIRQVDVAVADLDRTVASRDIVHTLTADGTVHVVARVDAADAIDALLDDGTVRMGLVLPRGLQTGLSRGQVVPVQLVVDGTDASFAGQAIGLVGGILGDRVRRDALAVVRRSGGPSQVPGLVSRPRVLFNEALNGTWFIIPGLIAVIISMLAALLTSQCVAREYEQGTIEQILVSPVSGPALMLAKLLPYVGLGIVQVLMVTFASRWLFQVPIRGSLFVLAVSTLLYLLGSMALGLMLSAAIKSQQVAMQIAFVATMLPSLLLSGFLFPISNMPVPLQAATYIVPARYYVTITRGLFLKGVGWHSLLPEIVAMAIFATALVLVASTFFRRTRR